MRAAVRQVMKVERGGGGWGGEPKVGVRRGGKGVGGAEGQDPKGLVAWSKYIVFRTWACV